MKIYECACGKTFDNPQRYNGHKRHCEIHLTKVDKFDNYQANQKAFTQGGQEADINKHSCYLAKASAATSTWVTEQHVCERCGKVMTEKFGSGRFCSRACANTRKPSAEEKEKISKTLLAKYEASPELRRHKRVQFLENVNRPDAMLKKHEKMKKRKAMQDSLFDVQDEVRERTVGWQSRSIKNSYPEQFWMHVFDLNGITYKKEFLVHNEYTGKKAAAYKMDFLIDNLYDIEIDGSQHKNTVEKDTRRDAYLQSLGYIVYRIPWVNPKNNESKAIVKEQIEALFRLLNKNNLYNA